MSEIVPRSNGTPSSGGLALLAELERTGALTMTSLTLPLNTSYATYEALFGMFGLLHEVSCWVIGDLINQAEKVHGETYAQAVLATGLAEQTLTNYASVCSRIPRSRRREGVKFGLHAEVAYLTPQEQTEWLDRAATNDWRRSQLREALAPVRERNRSDPVRTVALPGQEETEPVRYEDLPLAGELPEQLDAAEMEPEQQHICQCMKCGRYHRDDTDVGA